MDDDTDAKIRRNLVVFSTLIVLVAWLQIPVGEIAVGLLKLDKLEKPLQLSQFRLWVACFAVLLYMALRYRFTEEWGQFSREMYGINLNLQRALVQKTLDTALRRFHKTGKDSPLFHNHIEQLASKVIRSQPEHERLEAKNRPLGVVKERLHPRSEWEGEAKLEFTRYVNTKGAKNNVVYIEKVAFEIPERKQMEIKVVAFARSLFYSKFSVHYLVPFALAVAALTVVLYKLCTSV